MKFEAVIDEKHNNRMHLKISELCDKDFLFGDWRNFEGRERRNRGTGKIVNSKGNRNFAIRVPESIFMEDPIFQELVRRNYNFWELKPNPEYEQTETAYALVIKISYAHDPENPWKDPHISTFNHEDIEDLEEHQLVDLDHYRLLGATIECHTYDGEKCSLYLDDAVFEIEPPRQRADIRDRYRALLNRDESEDEVIPFN